ncbi:hypothetical protein DHD05_10280 [Arenibacter sp. N53]|uniref:Secreted protein n=1 Tax=Arenibacter echinorum TaxID=440515 RepID=A0A327R0Z0_9FLAO|nr:MULTISPECIES: hypothetical protein [Arenibacter]MCK0191952.1 hypothetical protein [Arenibacter sp. F20364]MCM4151978.1 hypothetical protein [Arenibacter sp. N53]RAJ10291.1 hypothetical protein LV92_03040 [Arenibacter echinorum]GBF20589.1 hypothetical protein C21_02762 [Arenibacter sp. NBRC 103722]
MKQILTKILSVTLAFAVLFATSSFMVDMHFCCNKLVDVAVFGKAKPCKDKKQNLSKPFKKCSIGQMDCCSNKSIVKKAEDNLKKSQVELDTNKIVFLQAFFHSYVNLFEGLEFNVVSFINYNPPWIEKDILVLHETFLI